MYMYMYMYIYIYIYIYIYTHAHAHAHAQLYKTINMTGYYFSVELPFSYMLSVDVVD